MGEITEYEQVALNAITSGKGTGEMLRDVPAGVPVKF